MKLFQKVSPATVLFIIHQFVTNYDKDPELAKLLQMYDWYLTPVLNVDGYQFTWQRNRLWRKNRSPAKRYIFLL